MNSKIIRIDRTLVKQRREVRKSKEIATQQYLKAVSLETPKKRYYINQNTGILL